MPLDDVTLKSLELASQGIRQAAKDIAVTRTIMGANDAVKRVRDSELNDAQKRQQLEQISQEAIFNLTSAGADTADVTQIAKAISPPPQLIQSLEQGLFARDPQNREIARKELARRDESKLEQLRARGGAESPFMDFKNRSKLLNDTRPLIKDDLSAIDAVDNALTELSVGTPQALNLTVKSLVSAREGGKISDKDFEIALPGLSLPRKFSRAAYTTFLNRATGGDITEMTNLLTKIRENASARASRRVQGRSKALAPSLGTTPENVNQVLSQGFGLEDLRPVKDRRTGEVRMGVFRNGKLIGVR